MVREGSRWLLAGTAGALACLALLALVADDWRSQQRVVSMLSKAERDAKIANIDSWETTTLAHSWKEEHAEPHTKQDGHPSIRTTFKIAQAQAMRQMERENAEAQKRAAKKDDKKATKLVGFAKQLAQKIVAREAVDEMRQWLHAHPPAAHKPKPPPQAKAAPTKQRAAAPARAVQARPAPKPAAPKTEAEIMKDDFRSWQNKKLRGYAKDNSLFTAQEFCNSRAVTAHPSEKDLRASFGEDWRDVAARHPRVASMAAVTSCLQSLGLADSRLQPVPRKAWTQGALKGKEGAVTLCAAGDEDACAELAKDKHALAGLKHLLPPH